MHKNKFYKFLTIIVVLFNTIFAFYPTTVFAAETAEFYGIEISNINNDLVKRYVQSLYLKPEGSVYRLIVNNTSIGSVTNTGTLYYYPNSNVKICFNVDIPNKKITFSYNQIKTKNITAKFVFHATEFDSKDWQKLTIYPNTEVGTNTTLSAELNGGWFRFPSYTYTYDSDNSFTYTVSINTNTNTCYIDCNGSTHNYSLSGGTVEKTLYVEAWINAQELELNYLGKLPSYNFATASSHTTLYSEEQINSAVSSFTGDKRLVLKNTPTGLTTDFALLDSIYYMERTSGGAEGTGSYAPSTPTRVKVICEYWDTEHMCETVRSTIANGDRLYAVFADSFTAKEIVSGNKSVLRKNMDIPSEPVSYWPTVSSDGKIEYSKRYAVWSPWSAWSPTKWSSSAITESHAKEESDIFYKYRTWGYTDATGWSTDTNFCSYMRDSTIKSVTDTRQDSLCGTQYKTCTVSTKVRCTKTRQENYTCKVDSTCSSSYDCSYDESYDTTCPYTYSCSCYDYCPKTDSRGNCLVAKQRKCSTCTGSQRCTKTRHVSKTCTKTVRCQVDGTCTRTVSYDDVCDSSSTGRYEVCGTENKTCTLTKCQRRAYHDWTDWKNEDMCRGAGSACQKSDDSLTQYRYSTRTWSVWGEWYLAYSYHPNTDEAEYLYRTVTKGQGYETINKIDTGLYTVGTLPRMTENQINGKALEMDKANAVSQTLEIAKNHYNEDNISVSEYWDWANGAGNSKYNSELASSTAGQIFKNKELFVPYVYIAGHWRAQDKLFNIAAYDSQEKQMIKAIDVAEKGNDGPYDLIAYEHEISRDSKVVYFDYHDPLANYEGNIPDDLEGLDELINKLENTDFSNAKISITISKSDMDNMKQWLIDNNYKADEDCSFLKAFSYVFDEETRSKISSMPCRTREGD